MLSHPKEIWRNVKGFEGYYQVSNLGRVRSTGKVVIKSSRRGRYYKSICKGKVLRLTPTKQGYLVVGLGDVGKSRAFHVHRLVLEAFVGPCPEGMECRHLNDNKIDNKLVNLKWGTREENVADMFVNGKRFRGEKHPWSRLNEGKVREIRNIYATGKHVQREIAKMFGIDTSTVSNIITGKRWGYVE